MLRVSCYLKVYQSRGKLQETDMKRNVAPVALFYNVANGFRNFPSYTITNEEHRRRDQITGLGTGLGVAGKVGTNEHKGGRRQ